MTLILRLLTYFFLKQTGHIVEEENGEVRNEGTTDTDYFGDIEASSIDSSELSRSDSEDGIPETHKGN